MTPVPERTRRLVLDRDGLRCVICLVQVVDEDFKPLTQYSIHHRRPRQMGGSKDPAINSPANLLTLCGTGTTGCHGWVETNRETAYRCGWLRHFFDEFPGGEVLLREPNSGEFSWAAIGDQVTFVTGYYPVPFLEDVLPLSSAVQGVSM